MANSLWHSGRGVGPKSSYRLRHCRQWVRDRAAGKKNFIDPPPLKIPISKGISVVPHRWFPKLQFCCLQLGFFAGSACGLLFWCHTVRKSFGSEREVRVSRQEASYEVYGLDGGILNKGAVTRIFCSARRLIKRYAYGLNWP